jgi:CheY-like chemotaxis protein
MSGTPGRTALADLRILVVEDDVLIALDVERVLLQEGCTVAGPAGTVERALQEIAAGGIDAGLLDVSLGREKVFPVADALAAAGIPFVLVTGHAQDALPPAHRAHPVLGKPYGRADLVEALRRALAR